MRCQGRRLTSTSVYLPPRIPIPSLPPPLQTRDVQWNFQTVLVDKKGNLYRRYSTTVDPADIAPDIEVLLAQ